MLACAIAGAYGAIHNQVSYTVSPDYFHAFKFLQFQFPESLRHRGGASLVGWLASWWMGIAIGPLLYMTYHRRLQAAPSASQMCRGLAITLVVTAIVGALALGIAQLTVSHESVHFAPQAAKDPLAFSRAGILHDGSYLGGVLGTIIACVFGLPRQPSATP